MAATEDDETKALGRTLYADNPGRDLDETRILKVKLPIQQHIQLHSMRVYRGTGISETVTAALALYFERLREVEATRAREPGGQALAG